MKKILFTILSIFCFCGLSYSCIAQTNRDNANDKTNQESIIVADIVLHDSYPITETRTIINGDFILEILPFERQSIIVSKNSWEYNFTNDLLRLIDKIIATQSINKVAENFVLVILTAFLIIKDRAFFFNQKNNL